PLRSPLHARHRVPFRSQRLCLCVHGWCLSMPQKRPDGMTETTQTPLEKLTVVALGASAGGLQALQEVLDGLPEELDAALVVVQHLSPDFETRMDQLLAGHTKLPIHRVE